MLGLKRGEVTLFDHEEEWEENVMATIKELKTIFGDTALEIEHVGSTAIRHIKAKPIIDIAVGVESFDTLIDVLPRLEESGIYKSAAHAVPNDILYVIGDCENDTRTHHIHIVEINSMQWSNYINLRDYLNACPNKAKAYENLKIELADKYPYDRIAYTDGKDNFIAGCLLEANIYAQMREKFDIKSFEPINKGWSEDKKYCVTKVGDTKFLLRISPIERFETRKVLFSMLQKVSELDIPMSKPVEFGTCRDGVYALHSWIDGKDAEDVIHLLSEIEQHVLGLKAGKILKKIHSIPAPKDQEDWYTRFNRKTNIKIQKYRECGLRFDGDDKVIEYIENNRDLLKNRPQSFQHGDYHIGNMMIENGELIIIDFDRFDFGDPWEEFNRIVWCAQSTPCFATGIVNGYFGGTPPMEFWELLAFYTGSNTLSSIYWALPFGQSEVDTMMNQAADVLNWYDNMKLVVPKWYMEDFKNRTKGQEPGKRGRYICRNRQ